MNPKLVNVTDSTILIVDDNSDNLRLLSDMLNKQGYTTRRAISGYLALQSLAVTQFDLILLDITMPDMNGYEVCQQLKNDQRFAHIPVIFISALNNAIDKVRAFQVGGIDYISKPFHLEEVLARIENQLRIINLQRQLNDANQQLMIHNQKLQQSNNRYFKNSLIDPITNFKTRISFVGQLRKALKLYSQNNNFFVLLIIQCDRLKLYSSMLLPELENQCLIYISQNIKNFVPDTSILGRLNETEFAVFIQNINIDNIDNILHILEEIQQKLKLPFVIDQQEYFLNPSCGIVVGDQSYQQPEQILCDARHALFYAQSQGHGSYQIFDPVIKQKTSIDSELKLNFIKALLEQNLTIDYQPIISLTTQKIVGQEAKVTWHSVHESNISLDKLGRLAAETGFISQLNYYFLSEVCDRIFKYQHGFLPDSCSVDHVESNLKIRVNLSSWQFLQSDLATQLGKIIENSQIDRNLILLVVNEKAFFNNMPLTIKNLKNLHQFSIKISINNFNNHIFNLVNKYDLMIDDLRIDVSSCGQATMSQADKAFYSAIITNAHNLGMTLTVDGIQNMEQFNSFKELKCEFAQGSWISHSQTQI